MNELHLEGLFGLDDYFGKNKTKQLSDRNLGARLPFPFYIYLWTTHLFLFRTELLLPTLLNQIFKAEAPEARFENCYRITIFYCSISKSIKEQDRQILLSVTSRLSLLPLMSQDTSFLVRSFGTPLP